jgi:hypothetical protein
MGSPVAVAAQSRRTSVSAIKSANGVGGGAKLPHVLPVVAGEHLTAVGTRARLMAVGVAAVAAVLPFDGGGGESGPSAAAAGSTLELRGYVYLARVKRIISSPTLLLPAIKAVGHC